MIIEYYLPMILALLIAIIGHEIAHGRMALKYGDKTALMEGRLSINPKSHIDPVGSLLLPGIFVAIGAPFIIGFAKPVPVNFRTIKMRYGNIAITKVAAAGIIYNLICGFIGLAIYYILDIKLNEISFINSFISYFILYNFVLALFNLLPIPPLDGSKILSSLSKHFNKGTSITSKIENFNPLFGFILIILLFQIEFVRIIFIYIIFLLTGSFLNEFFMYVNLK